MTILPRGVGTLVRPLPNRCAAASPGPNWSRHPSDAGRKIAKGTAPVSIEAIKMETALTADRDAVVKEMFVKPGDKVAAKDLLVVLQ